MTHVTCRLTAKNRDQLRNPTLGNRVWATFTFFNRDQTTLPGNRGKAVWTTCPWRYASERWPTSLTRDLFTASTTSNSMPILCAISGRRATRASEERNNTAPFWELKTGQCDSCSGKSGKSKVRALHFQRGPLNFSVGPPSTREVPIRR